MLTIINHFCLILGWIVMVFLLVMLAIGFIGYVVDTLRGDGK